MMHSMARICRVVMETKQTILLKIYGQSKIMQADRNHELFWQNVPSYYIHCIEN